MYRARHDAQPLVLSTNPIAQNWANTMAQMDSMQHSSSDSRPDWGENIAWRYVSGEWTADVCAGIFKNKNTKTILCFNNFYMVTVTAFNKF